MASTQADPGRVMGSIHAGLVTRVCVTPVRVVFRAMSVGCTDLAVP